MGRFNPKFLFKDFRNLGLTLVELVVVMAIVGLLLAATLAVLAPGKQIAKLNDSQRQQDIKQLEIALDTYYNDKNCYPQNLTQLTLDPIYIKTLPSDPENVSYYYITDSSTDCPQWQTLFSKSELRALQSSQDNNSSQLTADDCPLVDYSYCLPQHFSELYNHCNVTGSIDGNACSVLDAAELPTTAGVSPTLIPGGCYCENGGAPGGPVYDVRAGNCNLVNTMPYNYCDPNCSIACQ